MSRLLSDDEYAEYLRLKGAVTEVVRPEPPAPSMDVPEAPLQMAADPAPEPPAESPSAAEA